MLKLTKQTLKEKLINSPHTLLAYTCDHLMTDLCLIKVDNKQLPPLANLAASTMAVGTNINNTIWVLDFDTKGLQQVGKVNQ